MSLTDFCSLLPDQEEQIKAVYSPMSEKDRRRYAASLSLILPRGGCAYLFRCIDCNPTTITRGRKKLTQLQQHGDVRQDRIRREGAGRPKKDEEHPELPQELEKILVERTAGDLKDETICWTRLSIAQLTRMLCTGGVFVSWPVVKRLCDQRNLKKRQQVNSVTKAPSRDQDEQLTIIDRL